MNVFPKGDVSSSEGMLKWFIQIQWSTHRLPGINAGACLRPERSTELTPKSQAEGLRVDPALR